MRPEPDRAAGPPPRDVLFFSIFDWRYHSHGHSDFQLAFSMARNRRVLLVNSLGLRAPLPGRTRAPFRRIVRKASGCLRILRRPRPDLPGLSVLSPVSLPVYGESAWARLNSAAVATQVRLGLRACGIRNPLVITTPPTTLGVLRRLEPDRIAYNRSDLHSAFPEAGPEVIRLERELLAKANVVAYASERLAREEESLAGSRALVLQHGLDHGLFRADAGPDPEIASLPGPRIGFCGALREHAIDFPLVERLARSLPGVSVILVGDRDAPLESLLSLPNVHWFPPREHARMPATWRSLDLAVLPYRKTEWTGAINPIKLQEVLAMGLPIVATRIPALQESDPETSIAEDPDGFIEATVRMLARCRPFEAERRGRSTAPSWHDQAARLLGSLEGTRA
jgi:glycosyltransferase involved in cell wall biosynthesis